ncbi:DUF4625 domain-containing protein [Hymenobacter aerilatus]|uniref:DUF4625 domain-containing protein n=1 Tax=Hymenobacter aerilatus TaxID=2932251 RepID=A0A8T9T4E2_9BACT|nr:DUF4625 domain-containing protein [Hymenobacter aerilatus]UOR06779.1 DUF4625 domain-containing protein [Hymenobacter aerilatus]
MAALGVSGCSKDDDGAVDTEYPVINVDFAEAFPKQCSVLKRGQPFTFRTLLTDNVRLGSVSVDIHHNFDHHTHSTEVIECTMQAVKRPVNPFLLIKSFPIPEGVREYQTAFELSIPADVDPGDYHFMIRLTDQEGWQTVKGLSIKIE